jgi:general secretion pathway protein M
MAVLAVALLWYGIVAPTADLITGGEIANFQQTAEEGRRFAEHQPQLQAEKATLASAGIDRGDFLTGATPALAAAELQSRLGADLPALGVTIVSFEPLTLPNDHEFLRAGLRLKLSLRQDALPPMLHSLEYGRPHLFLPSLSIHGDAKEPLTMSLDLFGYLAPEEK